jgi:23S rRNA (cytosine1962-C5)-methyltransferase
VTAPGGILGAASCSSHVRRDDFVTTVVEGAARAGRRFVLEAVHGAGADHPTLAAFPEGDYLKLAIGKVV